MAHPNLVRAKYIVNRWFLPTWEDSEPGYYRNGTPQRMKTERHVERT